MTNIWTILGRQNFLGIFFGQHFWSALDFGLDRIWEMSESYTSTSYHALALLSCSDPVFDLCSSPGLPLGLKRLLLPFIVLLIVLPCCAVASPSYDSRSHCSPDFSCIAPTFGKVLIGICIRRCKVQGSWAWEDGGDASPRFRAFLGDVRPEIAIF